MYYAQYCKYGINVSYASMNGNAYDFYAFPTRQGHAIFIP